METKISNKIGKENTRNAFKFALKDLEVERDEDDELIKGGSADQYNRNPEEWKLFGINTVKEFKDTVTHQFKRLYKAINEKISREHDEEFIKVLTSSKLSHQLLLRAMSSGKIKLASKISKLSADMREGNVKVYEASNPQFSHEFYWKSENGRVHIAEVAEVKGDHIDEAYQAAFDAVKQEVLQNNEEISLG